MDSQRGPSVLPLRPLTVGELLDAAVCLVRDNARPLLPVAMALAMFEQLALYPLRRVADVNPPTYFPFPMYTDRLAQYWVLLGIGFLTEGSIIALLGGLTARASAMAISGRRLPARALLSPRGVRLGTITLVATLVGVCYGLASLACWLPWLVAYSLLGLAVPSVVVDGRGPWSALGRSIALSSRIALRAGFIRLLGYVAWLIIRIALGLGGITALSVLTPSTGGWLTLAGGLVLVIVNGVGYATIAALDAVLHLEVRMRTEGLDIVAFRASRQGKPIPLAVP